MAKKKDSKIKSFFGKQKRKFCNFVNGINFKDIPTNIAGFLKKIWQFLYKKRVSIISIIVILLFIFNIVYIVFSFGHDIEKFEGRMVYISDDSIVYIKTDNGYIIEELVVESGSSLPAIEDYFSEDSMISENASVLYYEDDSLLSYESFTYESDALLILKGSRKLSVLITDGEHEYKTKLNIVDRTPPYVDIKQITMKKGEVFDCKKFIDKYTDNSHEDDYTVELVTPTDYQNMEPGEYDVNIRICDMSDNCVVEVGRLVIEKSDENGGGNGNTDPDPNPNPNPKPPVDPKPDPDPKPPVDPPVEKKKKYTVKFSATGGVLGSGCANQIVTEGEKVTNSCKATYSGYKFKYWSTKKNGNIYNFDTAVNSNITLYAVWVSDSSQPSPLDEPFDTFYSTKEYFDNLKAAADYLKTQDPDEQAEVQRVFLARTNAIRDPSYQLTLDSKLCDLAMQRAIEVAHYQYGSSKTDALHIVYNNHVRPDGTIFSRFYRTLGYNSAGFGENVTLGNPALPSGTNEAAFEAFYGSTPHRNNMLNKTYTKMGVGRIYYPNGMVYWVVVFAI